MGLEQTTAFDQSGLQAIQGDGGPCFRLAFKWLACRLSGIEFFEYRYEDIAIETPFGTLDKAAALDAFAENEMDLVRNPVKTTAKAKEYRAAALAVSNDGNDWVGVEKEFLRKWAAAFNAKKHRNVEVGDEHLQGAKLQEAIDRLGEGQPAPWGIVHSSGATGGGHAVAYYRGADGELYFDGLSGVSGNKGEFSGQVGDVATAAGGGQLGGTYQGSPDKGFYNSYLMVNRKA